MKKALLFTFITILSLNYTRSLRAENVAVYLGATLNANRCSILAGSLGYPRYQFGGVVNGIYYWNACLGIRNDAPNPFGEATVFDVTTYEDAKICSGDIEFRVEGVTCRVRKDTELQCKTKRTDINNVKDLIYKVKCVKEVKKS